MARSLKKGSTESDEKSYRIKNRIGIVSAVIVLSLLSGFVLSSIIFTNPIVDSFATESLDSYHVPTSVEIYESQLAVYPNTNGEIWLIDDTLYVHDVVWIADWTHTLDYLSIDGVKYYFDNSTQFRMDTSNFESTSHTISFVSENPNGSDTSFASLRIYVSRVNLAFYRFQFLVGFFYSLVMTLSFGSIIIYLGIATHILNELNRFRIKDGDIETEPIDWTKRLFLLERTDLLRNNLEEKMSNYRQQRNTLMMAIGFLLATYGILITDVILNRFDLYITMVLGFAYVIGLVFLIEPVSSMLAEEDNVQRPSTIWHHKWRISEAVSESLPFKTDFERNYRLMKDMWTTQLMIEENTIEIVWLYYQTRRQEEKYSTALSGVKISVAVLLGSLVIGLSLTLPIYGYLGVLYIAAFLIALFLRNIVFLVMMISGKFATIIRTLYQCSTSTDQNTPQNENLENAHRYYGKHEVVIVETCNFDNKEWSVLRKKVKKGTPDRGRKPSKATSYVFGNKKNSAEWCGSEVPVLVVEVFGTTDTFEIYPRRDEDGTLITIYDYLISLEE